MGALGGLEKVLPCKGIWAPCDQTVFACFDNDRDGSPETTCRHLALEFSNDA